MGGERVYLGYGNYDEDYCHLCDGKGYMLSFEHIRPSWCAATSADPKGWTPENPSHGQCAVTALVVQDLLGGTLLRTINDGISHYWNRLPTGIEVDLTREQFRGWNPGEIVERDREYVLSFPETAARYELLKELMNESH